MRKNSMTVIAVMELSLAMALFLCYVNGRISVSWFAAFEALSLGFSALLGFMATRARHSEISTNLRSAVIKRLRILSYYTNKGVGLCSSLERLASGSDDAAVERLFLRIRNMVMMGCDFNRSLAAGAAGMGIALDVPAQGTIGKFLDNEEYAAEETAAQYEGSINRNALVAMFISAVLPSFLVFAFVGNTILSQRDANIFLFSVVMLVFLPLAYALGRMLMGGRIHA
ncbi:MAG: hypothetical protein KGH69_00965 [Candidatus Micrarchaeota archaeon]|nr:hypothetical protein [Candidatus Micrarchaeota archaeon]